MALYKVHFVGIDEPLEFRDDRSVEDARVEAVSWLSQGRLYVEKANAIINPANIAAVELLEG